jgi:hypothetical protein
MADGGFEEGFFIGVELYFQQLHDAGAAQLYRYADEGIAVAVLPFEAGTAGEDAFFVADDRLHHLGGCGAGCVPGAGAHELDELATSKLGALDDSVKRFGIDHLRDGDAGDRGVTRQRHHGIAVAAHEEGLDVFGRHVECLGEEGPVAGGIEDTGHAEYFLPGEAGGFPGGVRHDVEGVGHDDDDGIGGVGHDGAGDGYDDFGIGGDEVVAAHTRLAGHAGGDDDDIGVGGILVVVGPFDAGAVMVDGRLLPGVKGLAPGHVTSDIEQDDLVDDVFVGEHIGAGGAYVAGADYGYFGHDVLVVKRCKSRSSDRPNT